MVLSMLLCLTNTVYALADYTPITALPNTTKSTGCAPKETNCTNLQTYVPGLFKLSIGIAAVMAFVMITVGGIVYATSDSLTNKSEGRRYIENALWGLLLVIGAYVILNTINPKILSFDFTPDDASSPPVTTLPPVTTGATGLQPNMYKALTSLRNACGCDPAITSTTGDTHNVNSLHYQGLAVDLRPSNPLNDYIIGSIASSPQACASYTKTLNGVSTRFLYEAKGSTCGGTVPSTGDHWHMSVQ